MSDDDDMVRIDVDSFETETHRAVLFKVDGEKLWVPKSVVDDWTDDWVDVQRWWAEKEGLD
jgi:hypothetical protein